MKLKTTEKGFTLIELLVALAIAAFVTAAASMTIITMMRLSPRTNDLALAQRQVQNAGYWVSQDITMARHNSVVINGQLPALDVDVWNGTTQAFVLYHISYVFNGQMLMRNDGVSSKLIAENIDTAHTGFIDITPVPQGLNKKEYQFTVRAVVNSADITRIYRISPRLP